MKPIDAISPTAVSRLAAVGKAKTVAQGAAQEAQARPAARADTARVTQDASPPIDSDRVNEIRQAVQQKRYPIIPARIADAMIAAPYLLNAAKD